ncbi:TonB-dependent siderophore receptor [Pseudomonas sp. PA15(2017)]|uniref:TonB-dependent receptor n=1 Tax=Pseudomonas sp. PA15(2017) TaxID=1932111 RepID=UPI00095C3DB0|nr:TonB-dependent receptor [Pseudomonas sp. PA15(2017)]OLU23248.1 TonB-dependent siderophore receptor [Pseudomonas sp. PA15(2017)]
MKTRDTSLVLLLGACNIAWAQDASVELDTLNIQAEYQQPSGISLDQPIKTGSRLGLTARETPASVSISDRSVIEERGAKDTQEVINGMTGINASANPGYGGFVAYRGFTQNQITQLFNGINLGYSSASRPVDSWMIDRVELIGGPSTFLYGAGAVGGSINYISKLANREQQLFEGRLRYGSFDESEVSLGVNQALGGVNAKHFLRLDYSRGQSNGYIDRNERETNSFAISLLSDLTPDLSHTLAVEHPEDRDESPYWGSPVLDTGSRTMKIDKSRRFENYNSADGRYEQRVRWVRSIVDYQLGSDTSLQNTLYNYDAQRDYRNLESYRYTSDNSQVVRSGAYMQRHEQQLLGNRLELTHGTSLFGLGSQWAVGVDYSLMKQALYPTGGTFSEAVDPKVFDPGSFYDVSGMGGGYRKQRGHEITTRALFLENRLSLTDRLSLLTGLRYDHLQMEVTNYGAVSATSPAFFKRSWEPLSGRIGLMYELSPDANLYLQYSTSADLPAGALASATYSNVGLFDLSKGEQWEVGSKFDFIDGRGSATIALYQIVRRDFAVRDSVNPNLTVQAGQQTSRGIEVAGKFQLTPKLLAEANYAYVEAEYDEFNEAVGGASVSREGNNPINIPDSVANLWLTYSLTPDWYFGVDSRYVASVYANNANTIKAPSYTLFGAFARYRVDDNTSITARVRNLTDEVYAKQAYGSQYYMGAPRSVDVALDMRF